MKTVKIRIVGRPETYSVQVDPIAQVSDVLHALRLPNYGLRPEGSFQVFDEDAYLYRLVVDGDRLVAELKPVPVAPGGVVRS